MLSYNRFTLKNGLTVLIHQDISTPVVAFNIIYKVGAKNEDPQLTGFAHLFEHLMFGGSIHIPKYDEPLQMVGGENNAFTNNDITNYYISLPKENIETAFWLESDRMLNLAFSEKSLEVQRQVVIEEYKQRYLNQPYGDLWLHFRPLIYTQHPYQWATIGKSIEHIEQAKMEDVKAFYHKFYNPSNAILVVAGDVEEHQIRALCEKWFEPIQNEVTSQHSIAVEPEQREARFLKIERDVPTNLILKAFHMVDRVHPDYPAFDFLSDLMGNGKSSLLHQKLVKELNLFSSLSCYISGDEHPGIIYFAGHLADKVEVELAEMELSKIIYSFKDTIIAESDLQKVKNKYLVAREFDQLNVLDKAMNLAYYEYLGNADGYELERENYMKVQIDDIQRVAATVLIPQKCNTLHYLKKDKV